MNPWRCASLISAFRGLRLGLPDGLPMLSASSEVKEEDHSRSGFRYRTALGGTIRDATEFLEGTSIDPLIDTLTWTDSFCRTEALAALRTLMSAFVSSITSLPVCDTRICPDVSRILTLPSTSET